MILLISIYNIYIWGYKTIPAKIISITANNYLYSKIKYGLIPDKLVIGAIISDIDGNTTATVSSANIVRCIR